MSNSLQLHGLQHARLPCQSSTSWVCSISCPSSQWYHQTISSCVIPFSSRLQSFPASGTFKWVSSSHQVEKVLEFQLHQSLQWIFRTNFFKIYWFDLLAVQVTLKSLLQHHSSKAPVLQHLVMVTICSDFGVQKNKVCHCFHCFPIFKYLQIGTFLSVQWLRLHLSMQGVWVWALVGELSCRIPCSQTKQNMKQKQCCKKFNKDF